MAALREQRPRAWGNVEVSIVDSRLVGNSESKHGCKSNASRVPWGTHMELPKTVSSLRPHHSEPPGGPQACRG